MYKLQEFFFQEMNIGDFNSYLFYISISTIPVLESEEFELDDYQIVLS